MYMCPKWKLIVLKATCIKVLRGSMAIHLLDNRNNHIIEECDTCLQDHAYWHTWEAWSRQDFGQKSPCCFL